MKTTQEIADMIVADTLSTTDVYFKNEDKTKIDKQLWAWLHIGIMSGLVFCGYEEKQIAEALELSQKELSKIDTVPY